MTALTLADRLAVERTRLAIERTLLAYLRTALTFSVAGLSLMRFFQIQTYRVVGVALLIIGIALLIFGIYRTRAERSRLDHTESATLAADE